MSEIGDKYYRRPLDPGPKWQPDLSRIPAYVEPPRPRSGKPDHTQWRVILALGGFAALASATFLGFDYFASQLAGPPPGLQRTAEMMPPQRMPTVPRDVPLPAGMLLPPPPPPAPAATDRPVTPVQAARPLRQPRPAHG